MGFLVSSSVKELDDLNFLKKFKPFFFISNLEVTKRHTKTTFRSLASKTINSFKKDDKIFV